MNVINSRFLLQKCFYVVTLSLFVTSQCLPQSYSIKGTITDTFNKPVQYVNVAIIGTDYGDASDDNGWYEIPNLRAGKYNIKFSAIGYDTYEMENLVVSNGSLLINIVLMEEIIESDMVVVTSGKYEQKKSELPVSVEIIGGPRSDYRQ